MQQAGNLDRIDLRRFRRLYVLGPLVGRQGRHLHLRVVCFARLVGLLSRFGPLRLLAHSCGFQRGLVALASLPVYLGRLGAALLILTLQSGLPLPVTQITNFNAFAGLGTQRPNRLRDPNLPDSQRTLARYFDTDAFAVAPQFTLGNSSRNPVRGPGVQNLDLAVIKRMKFGDKVDAEFRGEVFNVTNTPPLGNPNIVLGSPGFGSISSAGDPRVVQLAVKLHW